MSIVKKRLLSMLIGISLLVIALFMNGLNLLRAVFCIVSVIILTYSFQLERQNKKIFVPLFVIIFSLFVIALDYLCVTTFKRTPILAYSIVTNGSGTVYNAIGYRVWTCKDKTFKVDPLYKLGYYCEKETLKSENINNVLTNVVNDFNRYKDSYVKIIGKIKKVVNDNMFYMESYREENSVISFDSTYRLYVEFNYSNKNLSTLEENSIVTVVGKLDRIDGNYVYMIDSSFNKEVSSSGSVVFGAVENIYCEYDKELWFQTNDYIFYKSCIDDVNITIGNNQYNLQNAIKNNLITLNEIKEESLGFQQQTMDNSTIFNYKDFKILICDESKSKDIIVGRNSMDFSDGYCSNINSDRGV